MASKAQLKASKKYCDKNTFIKSVRFNHITESYLIEYIDNSKEPFATLVKRLIREELSKKDKHEEIDI